MEVALTYDAPSSVETEGGQARVRFAGATQRPRVRWRGAVKDPLAVREALLALHEVVIAHFRWRPPERRGSPRPPVSPRDVPTRVVVPAYCRGPFDAC